MLSNELKRIANKIGNKSDEEMWEISVDDENNAETWWANVSGKTPFSAETKPLTHGNANSITLPEWEAQKFIDWASKIEGWYDLDAPAYASEPLVYGPVDSLDSLDLPDPNQ